MPIGIAVVHREAQRVSPFWCLVSICSGLSLLCCSRNFERFQSWSFALSHRSTHRHCWLSARCHCSDCECLHNISLLFARQKMVLVIASCWLHPAEQEWVSAVQLSGPVSLMPLLHVLASLPNTRMELLRDHQFVRWLYCSKESVQVLCIFFLFCRLSVCPLWWGHRHWWWMVEEGTICTKARLEIGG